MFYLVFHTESNVCWLLVRYPKCSLAWKLYIFPTLYIPKLQKQIKMEKNEIKKMKVWGGRRAKVSISQFMIVEQSINPIVQSNMRWNSFFYVICLQNIVLLDQIEWKHIVTTNTHQLVCKYIRFCRKTTALWVCWTDHILCI